MKRRADDTVEECAKRIRAAVYKENDPNKRAKTIAEELGLDEQQIRVEVPPSKQSTWTYVYDDNEFNSITRFVSYIFTSDDDYQDANGEVVVVAEKAQSPNNVCALFNKYLKEKNIEDINEEAFNKVLRQFVCESWMLVEGNTLSSIKNAYYTLMKMYVEDEFIEFMTR